MNVLRKLWWGGYSLPAAFWGFYALGLFVVFSLSIVILILSYGIRASTIGFIIGFLLIVAYWFVASVGVWNSARANIASPVWLTKVWGFAARSVVALFAVQFFWWLANGGALYLTQRMTTRLDF